MPASRDPFRFEFTHDGVLERIDATTYRKLDDGAVAFYEAPARLRAFTTSTSGRFSESIHESSLGARSKPCGPAIAKAPSRAAR
jgi:hypothetical protein